MEPQLATDVRALAQELIHRPVNKQPLSRTEIGFLMAYEHLLALAMLMNEERRHHACKH